MHQWKTQSVTLRKFSSVQKVCRVNNGWNIREEINPAAPETPEIVYAGKIFRLNDRVMQMRNNYDIKLYNRSGKQVGEGVFNGDIGTIRKISGTNVVIEFDGRYMDCPQVLLDDLELYGCNTHKSNKNRIVPKKIYLYAKKKPEAAMRLPAFCV